MAGLLDMVNDPRQAFLTQLGMGLLSAGGPSAQPRSFGQAFGAAMAPALQGAQQTQEYQMAQEEARRKQMAEAARQQTIEQFISSLPPEQQAIARANPEEAIKAFYKQQEDYTLPPGSVRYRGGQPLVSAPFKPPEPTDFERTLIAAGLQPGTPGYSSAMSDYIRKQTTHAPAPSAQVVMAKPDSKYAEERLKSQAGAMAEVEKSAQSAWRQNQLLDRFIESSQKGFVGGAAPVKQAVGNFLASFGYSGESLKETNKMAAALNEIVMTQMGELGARGLTDRDMEKLVASLPRIETDAAARVEIAQLLKRANEGKINDYLSQIESERQTYPELASRVKEPLWAKEFRKKQRPAMNEFEGFSATPKGR